MSCFSKNTYTIYLDESANCAKFRFKGEDNHLNAPWYNDFVLAGIAIQGGDLDHEWAKEVISGFSLQKKQELKLGALVRYNGEDPDRFEKILASKNIKRLLRCFGSQENLYLHWAATNLPFYSLADIIDAAFYNLPEGDRGLPDVPTAICIAYAKNVLYKYAHDDEWFFGMIASFDYPNIAKENIPEFCGSIIKWIRGLDIEYEEREIVNKIVEALNCSADRQKMIFLQGNTDKIMIENFVPQYAERALNFPESVLHFDKVSIVESNIDKYIQASEAEGNIAGKYDFVDSRTEAGIQLADCVAGMIGALMAYLNTHNEMVIADRFRSFTRMQRDNLISLMKLLCKSSRHDGILDYKNINEAEGFNRLYALCLL